MIGADPDTNLNASAGRQLAVPPSCTARNHTTQEDLMRINRKVAVAVGAAAIVVGGASVAVASAGSDADSTEGPDVPITGEALQRASDAALAETGGGRVTGSEVGDEESYYEVEVTLVDGRQVDVQLDEDFQVVRSSADVENSDEGAG